MTAGSLPDHVQPQGVPPVPEQAVLGDAHPVQQWSVGLHVCCHLYSYLHHDPSGMPCFAAAAQTPYQLHAPTCLHSAVLLPLSKFFQCVVMSPHMMQLSSLT